MGREFDSHLRLRLDFTMKRSLRIERLARREEKATIKRTIYLSIVSIVLGTAFFILGIPFLGKVADLLGGILGGKNETVQEALAPQAPILDDLPSATNSARLAVSGFSPDGKSVEIYLNDEKTGTVEVLDNHFVFENLTLKDGENRISAKAVNTGSKTSGSSITKTVLYNTKEPKLNVETPADGQSFSGNNRIKVTGTIGPDAQVYANGFLASVNFEGKFEVLVPVSEGETTIEVRAIDQAGNTKIEKRKINFKK